MIGIKELIEYKQSYIKYVFRKIDWSGLREEGLTDEDERKEYFLFKATNNWTEDFDFIDFIQDSYKINDIEEVMTGKTVCNLIHIIHSYHIDNFGECYIDFGNIDVKDVIRNWVYVHAHLNIDEIEERIREEIILFVGEKQLERFWEDSYEIGYK